MLTMQWWHDAACTQASMSLLLLLLLGVVPQVFAPASEPLLLLLADSAVRSAEAAAAGQEVPPEDCRELRVQRFVQVRGEAGLAGQCLSGDTQCDLLCCGCGTAC